MTQQELYNHLYSWANTSLGDLPCPVIRAYQDAPPPVTDTYIVIDDDGGWDSVGSVTRNDLEASGSTYSRKLTTNFVVSIVLWEVRGRGDRLRRLLASLDTREVQLDWQASLVSVMSASPVTASPTLQDTRWRHQHRLELTLGIANAITEVIQPIETVEFNNQIGGM